MRSTEGERRALVIPAPGLSGLLEALPLAASLAAAGARVDVVAAAPESSLLELAPPPVAAVSLDEPASPWNEVFLLDRRLRTAWWARRRGIARRFGCRGTLSPFLHTDTVDCAAAPGHGVRNRLLTAAGVMPVDPPWLRIPPVLAERVAERLARGGIEDPRELVVVAPGSAFEVAVERLRALRREDPRRRFVLLTATAELWTAVRVHETTGRLHPVLGPDLDLPVHAALLARADRLLSDDPLHRQLARAVGTSDEGLE